MRRFGEDYPSSVSSHAQTDYLVVSLSPVAYSMLADLIHQVRTDLSLPLLTRIIHTYSSAMHDPTLPPGIHTMCSKLLLNMIDPVISKDSPEGPKILRQIMEVCVSKLEALVEIRDEWMKWSKPRPKLSSTLAALASRDAREREEAEVEVKRLAEESRNGAVTEIVAMEEDGVVAVPNEDRMVEDSKDAKPKVALTPVKPVVVVPAELDGIDIERAKPTGRVSAIAETQPEPLKGTFPTFSFQIVCASDSFSHHSTEIRFMIRNCIFMFKTLSTALTRLEGVGPDATMVCRLFEAGVKSMVFFDATREQGRDQKDVMELFSQTLVNADLATFQEVLDTRIELFIDELIRNHELLVIPQNLLSNEFVSQPFASILWRYLMGRLHKIGEENKEHTAVVLRLFKMSFMAVTIFPDKNEAALLPHLGNLIMRSIKLASTAAEPSSYYLLLRALFRSIGGGRFELLYKEVLPLLQVLLEQLNALLKAADKSKRDLFAELILTVPVRLSVLLPYLSYLMKPLVHALQAGPDLVSQGLRTLELCVDNLTQEFLNPLMAPVIDEVMAGLWKLLRPLPFNHLHSHTTMRILGKIGGRNRKLFNPLKLEWKPAGDEALLNMRFDGKDAAIRIAPIVDLALTTIRRGDVHYRRAAYAFFKYSVALFLKDVCVVSTLRPSVRFCGLTIDCK